MLDELKELELIKAIQAGKTIQYLRNGYWIDAASDNQYLTIWNWRKAAEGWRVKPEIKSAGEILYQIAYMEPKPWSQMSDFDKVIFINKAKELINKLKEYGHV
jgi:hypothetical protein